MYREVALGRTLWMDYFIKTKALTKGTIIFFDLYPCQCLWSYCFYAVMLGARGGEDRLLS